MKIHGTETVAEVCKEIGSRIKSYRIEIPMTRQELAEESGVSVRTIARIESGESTQFDNIIRIMKAMNCLGRLDLLIQQQQVRPTVIYDRGQMRKRAISPKYRKKSKVDSWIWEEDKH